jgi:tryptophan 2,3-dioxygenase
MLYYSDYLALDAVLGAQHMESAKHGAPAHEEMLFIITHQAFELWFKQVLFEVDSVIRLLDRPYVPEADMSLCLSRIIRVNKIMAHLAEQFTLIETMTPGEFMEFRAFLNPASGFQSVQWRILERTLGLPEQKRVLRHYTEPFTPEQLKQLDDASSRTTLFAAVQRWLEQMPFMEHGEFAFWDAYKTSVQSMLDNDRREVRVLAEAEGTDPTSALEQIDANERSFLSLFSAEAYEELRTQGVRRMSQRATLAALFISTYRDRPLLQSPYRFVDAIIELDRHVSLWRYRHTMMVSRMIGMRVGTGGSSGHDYLMQTTIRQRVFDDLTSLSSYLVPTQHTPPLPEAIEARLQFVNERPGN